MAQYDYDSITILDDNLPTLYDGCWLYEGEVGGGADTLRGDIKVTTPFWNNIYKGVS